MMPWAAAVSKPPTTNTQHQLLQQQQQQQLHQNHHHHQQQLLQHHHLQQQQQLHQHQNSSSTILNANNINNSNNQTNNNNSSFEPYTGSIGCWSLPETNNSSGRGGWNANDGTLKGDGVADDGTAIWGATKKTGIDWTEKELLLNPPKANNSNNSEKRIQKTETSVSSINGTEAWGAPAQQPQQQQQPIAIKSTTTNNPLTNPRNCNDSQSQLSNDNSGKNDDFGTIDTICWGGESSLSRAKNVITNENSSPSINSNNVWNSSGLSKQQPQAKASDWLSSSNGGASNRTVSQNNIAAVRQQQIDQQSGASDGTSSNQFIQPITGNKNSPDLNASLVGGGNNGRSIGGGGNNIGCIGANSGNNNINDLKLSANYSNELLDSPNRQISGSVTSNNRQSQFDTAAYANNVSNSSAAGPSRELLKQMVHQIQLAVQAGHLNAQIMNQPMSTPTLQLVYQLLQQIKNLHHLQELKANSNSNSSSSIDMQISRTTYNISQLHKAITQQQAAMGNNNEQQQQQQQQIGENKQKSQQNSANNYSYATVSKISTNQKVPSSTNNIISNIDSFNKSSLIDTLKNDSNSDTLRSVVQTKFDTNATFDKNFAPSMQPSSSADNVLVSNNKAITVSSDFSNNKGQQNFISANQTQQLSTKGSLLSAQSSASSSSSTSSAAWSIFNSSGDYNPQQSWPSQLRISSNQVSQQDHQQHQFGAFDLASDFGSGKAWCNLSDDKDNAPSLAPGGNIGSNIVRPSSAVTSNASSNLQKHLNGNNLLNNEESSSSLFYDWNNDSELEKRNHFGQISSSSSGATSSIGNSGLSLQSNPWLFSQNNLGNGNLIDNLVKNGRNVSSSNKLDSVNGSVDKPILGADAFKSNNVNNSHHRPATSALFDWSNMAASASAIQFNISGDDNNKQQNLTSGSSSGLIGSNVGRPGPPPGLLSGNNNFAQQSSQVGNTINSIFDVDSMHSRDTSASLWSGAWLD